MTFSKLLLVSEAASAPAGHREGYPHRPHDPRHAKLTAPCSTFAEFVLGRCSLGICFVCVRKNKLLSFANSKRISDLMMWTSFIVLLTSHGHAPTLLFLQESTGREALRRGDEGLEASRCSCCVSNLSNCLKVCVLMFP